MIVLLSMSIFTGFFGDENTAARKRAEPIVAAVNVLEETYKSLSDDVLRDKTAEFKARLAKGDSLDSLAAEAFAAVREVSRRTLGLRHFDVQLIGGMILHNGDIAEMRTGEGKTLVATLPAYLNALTGKGVHVVTVNDYLSRRDAVWMGQIYHALGMSVAVINHDASFVYDPTHVPPTELASEEAQVDAVGSFKVMPDFLRPVSRHDAYAADITYGTNNEFGFDYLRDNIEYEVDKVRQRLPGNGGLPADQARQNGGQAGFNFALTDWLSFFGEGKYIDETNSIKTQASFADVYIQATDPNAEVYD